MLVDVEFALQERLNQAKSFFAQHYGRKGYPANEAAVVATFGHHTVKPGVHLASLNARNCLDDFTDHERECEDRAWAFKTTYGVADTPEQIIAFLEAEQLGCPHTVLITPISRAHQPAERGWRWSKWGRYIGTRTRQADYLADEPEIERVYVWTAIPIDAAKHEAARTTAQAAEASTPSAALSAP